VFDDPLEEPGLTVCPKPDPSVPELVEVLVPELDEPVFVGVLVEVSAAVLAVVVVVALRPIRMPVMAPLSTVAPARIAATALRAFETAGMVVMGAPFWLIGCQQPDLGSHL